MTTTSIPDSGGDRFDVRLAWPDADELPVAETVAAPDGVPWSSAADAPGVLQASVVAAAEVQDAGASLRRAIVEAHDRLGDRVLERMHVLREDVDADLSELRSELSSLRQAVDDLGDRVQLRQLRSTVDDLRSDVSSLRRAVLEWPELERVSGDVTALRADLTELLGRASSSKASDGAPAAAGTDAIHESVREVLALLRDRPPLPTLAPALEELGGLRADVDRLQAITQRSDRDLAEELAGLREELVALRRRISLRVGAAPAPEVTLSDDQLAHIADVVVARLGGGGRRPRR